MDRPLPGLMNNTPPPADAQVLWRHFSETYFSLRLGLAVLAFAFPAVLYFWGLLQNIHHTNADAGYTTAGALPQGPQSVSPLLLRGSPYREYAGTSHLQATASKRQDWWCRSSICCHLERGSP